jgi:hypothetical protein
MLSGDWGDGLGPGLSDAAMQEIEREYDRHETQLAAAKAEAAERRAAPHADHERRVTSIINSHRLGREIESTKPKGPGPIAGIRDAFVSCASWNAS